MEVILLESVPKLGTMGTIVKVKNGYGRNYLIPTGLAIRATHENVALFEDRRAEIEAENIAKKNEATQLAAKMKNLAVDLIRQAGEDGRLFGSVTPRDIASAILEKGFEVERNSIVLITPIKSIGVYQLPVRLHAEVSVEVSVSVARSIAEAAANAAAAKKAEKEAVAETIATEE